jgi:ribonucleoside-diphosphate reductase alpha chain
VKEEAPKMSDYRPDELECKVLRFKNEDKKNWISFVGVYGDKAYEIFTGINDLDELPIPSYIESGKIIKVSLPEGSRYDFSYLDKYGYVNTVGGLNRVFNKEYWNYARFVSALLREGTPIDKVIKVIDGLTFTNKGMNSFQAGLIRSLKLFVPDGTTVHGATCENCRSHNIIYESGCIICRDCGSSHCG